MRWGRTGTSGSSKLVGPKELELALSDFIGAYVGKVGKEWSARHPGAAPLPGKYQHLRTKKYDGKAGKWQYFLTSDPMGKADGWYDYDPGNAAEVEKLFHDHHGNPILSTRFVHSDTSGFTYKVDLEKGMQTNVTSGRARPIRRVVD
mmetsp:Transcript_24138/g.70806  ORF Transcript_24138/g.70806 Transcript_24138/m.70806 type:complete len:147 (-) Transcript_24138:21-461(-)